jgi:hypothetical protein
LQLVFGRAAEGAEALQKLLQGDFYLQVRKCGAYAGIGPWPNATSGTDINNRGSHGPARRGARCGSVGDLFDKSK